MKETVTVITPSGDRPDTLAILRRCIERQTVKPDTWLLIDDGIKTSSQSITDGLPFARYIRRTRAKNEGHTLKWQMLEALKNVDSDIVIIMEDDDWYSDDYIELVLKNIGSAELFGWSEYIAYHLCDSTYKKIDIRSSGISIWALTAFRRSVYKRIMDLLPDVDGCAVDLLIWRSLVDCRKTLSQLDVSGRRWIYLALKGYASGRMGTTRDHYAWCNGISDQNGTLLASIVGSDKAVYDEFKKIDDEKAKQWIAELSKLVTLVTPGVTSYENLALLRRSVETQTLHPADWIVVDDGEMSSELVLSDLPYVHYLNIPRAHDAARVPMEILLLEALKYMKTPLLVIMGDEGEYDKNYIRESAESSLAVKNLPAEQQPGGRYRRKNPDALL